MARKKSTPGGKANPTSTETSINSTTSVSDANPVAAEAASADIKPEPKVAPTPRKFEVRRPETRKNVVPINLEDEIRRRAYELYQQRQPGSGSEAEDWLTAEREVRQRYHQQSA
jgi:hypothetical protein